MNNNIIEIDTGKNTLKTIWKGGHLWFAAKDLSDLVCVTDKAGARRNMSESPLQKMDFGDERVDYATHDIDAIIYIAKSKSNRGHDLDKARIILDIINHRDLQIKNEGSLTGKTLKDAFSIYQVLKEMFEDKGISPADIEPKANAFVLRQTGIDINAILES